MATRSKQLAKANQSDTKLPAPQISAAIESLQNDPNVIKFDVKVNKKTGLVRYNASNADGRTMTKTILGPGLEAVVRYDPSKASTHDRDENIRTLLASGLTQDEAAIQLGVSQALVSKVHRSR